MKLLTKALEARFAEVGRQESKGLDAVVVAKYFTPDSSWSWFATESLPQDREFFGLVQGMDTELGYFSLDELESARGPMGLKIERDLSWTEMTIREVQSRLAKGVAP